MALIGQIDARSGGSDGADEAYIHQQMKLHLAFEQGQYRRAEGDDDEIEAHPGHDLHQCRFTVEIGDDMPRKVQAKGDAPCGQHGDAERGFKTVFGKIFFLDDVAAHAEIPEHVGDRENGRADGENTDFIRREQAGEDHAGAELNGDLQISVGQGIDKRFFYGGHRSTFV